MTRLLVLVALLATLLLAGCGQSDDEARDSYCEQIKDKADEMTRTVDEGGAGAFVELLPTFEDLADAAPSDLKDEWRTFVNALLALRDALEDTGVEPDEVDGKLPDDLTGEERRRVRSTAALLVSADVVAAVQGIEQHGLDVCHTAIL